MFSTPNLLIHETSPYLLQHAYNPVQWHPWNNETLDKALQTNTPILISIGYATCHWCHVMATETFTNQEAAEVMNTNFICAKVDREERPDVDQIYMEALRTMGLTPGWPLHAFLMPDQKPFYGGTYFSTKDWINMLHSIVQAYHKHRTQLANSATQFTHAIDASIYTASAIHSSITLHSIHRYYDKLAAFFDPLYGGIHGIPKFPLPSIHTFLLHYYLVANKKEALQQVEKTITNMAYGGIYDQIGGGFARYTVDAQWHIPHFEKMLYDNSQLLSIYAHSYQITHNILYKNVLNSTVDFLMQYMQCPEGGYYSALDADSEEIEGKYYVWKQQEIEAVLQENAPLIIDYFQIAVKGNWKNGDNILYCQHHDTLLAKKYALSIQQLQYKIAQARKRLAKYRSQRIQPSIDTKIIAAWNGMLLQGLLDAYRVLGNSTLLNQALATAQFIVTYLTKNKYIQRCYPSSTQAIHGYLEDYAWLIQAFLKLYQVTLDTKWLHQAKIWMDDAMLLFYDEKDCFFLFSAHHTRPLIASKKSLLDEIYANPNAIMSHNLWQIGMLYNIQDYVVLAKKMIDNAQCLSTDMPLHWASWAEAYLKCHYTHIVAIIGPDYKRFSYSIQQACTASLLCVGSAQESTSPLLIGKRMVPGKTVIYLCKNNTCCYLPLDTVQEALRQLQISS